MATSPTSNPAGSPKITDNTPRPTTASKPLASKLVKVPKSDVDPQRKA